MKIAVVTPYHTEPQAWLDQCQGSVAAQTHPATHILVADGHPLPAFDADPAVRHVKLPQANADYGNTPRAIGSFLADSWGFDAVCFLDADNWLAPDHIETMLAEHRASKAPIVGCKRHLMDAEGAPLNVFEKWEEQHRHVDTSCWLITRPAFSVFSAWLMPKPLGAVGDRVFFQKTLQSGHPVWISARRTVHYRSVYKAHYLLAGRQVPEGAKDGGEHHAAVAFLASPEGQAECRARLGFVPNLELEDSW